ncbi:GAF domain-containing SpoIIE family protein phosphatase [Roseivirga echinicomitans]
MRICLAISTLLWLIMTLLDVLQVLAFRSDVDLGISSVVPVLIMDFFFVFVVLFYRLRITKVESTDFIDYLWRVFAIGLIATLVSLALGLFKNSIADSALANNPFLEEVLYSIRFGLISVFLISTFTVWKKLILYQKSKRLVIWWNVFESVILLSIFFNLTGGELQTSDLFKVLFGVITLMALILSANLKWVAYLNFKQKWKSILLILLITIYLGYFFTSIYVPGAESMDILRSIDNLFIVSLFIFLLFYSIFSLLVILFNLPTSSVFEKKMEEAINFQRLSQSIQQGENENQIFDILLTSSMSAVFVEAGWLEIARKGNTEPEVRRKNLSPTNRLEVVEQIKVSKQKTVLKNPLSKATEQDQILVIFKKSNFRSVLIVPLIIQGKVAGHMYLLNELSDGFNKEMINIINTFASQASISIENFRLLGEALENERYKKELNIAKKVQRALLPVNLDHDSTFQIHAFTQAPDEVGGDYYDTFKLSDHRFVVVIGDVSGKGTSAAFHMSQMKGIFQSLVQLDLPPDQFLILANRALSDCLEKTSFITLSYFVIDTENKSVEYSRAGHCPTLFYSSQKSSSEFLENKGLGLGILRNDTFRNYVFVNKLTFQKDDIIVLYTDGISEASNHNGEEFGYDRMKKILTDNAKRDAVSIQKIFIEKLFEFCEEKNLNDDYTIVVIKFN